MQRRADQKLAILAFAAVQLVGPPGLGGARRDALGLVKILLRMSLLAALILFSDRRRQQGLG